jgi:hypothetical protein
MMQQQDVGQRERQLDQVGLGDVGPGAARRAAQRQGHAVVPTTSRPSGQVCENEGPVQVSQPGERVDIPGDLGVEHRQGDAGIAFCPTSSVVLLATQNSVAATWVCSLARTMARASRWARSARSNSTPVPATPAVRNTRSNGKWN